MLVRAGTAFTIPVLFGSGRPDGDVSFKIYSPAGGVLHSVQIPVPADAVSIDLQAPAAANELPAGAVLSYRDAEWSYTIEGAIVNGELRYSLEARLPFGVSPDGVRAKLGVDAKDLPNSDISLARAYLSFSSTVSTAAIDPTNSALMLAVSDAIEALAALALLPTMSVRVASSEDSGTNAFKRQEVDWAAVALALEATVSAGYLAVNPTYDITADFGPLLIVVSPATDAITGA